MTGAGGVVGLVARRGRLLIAEPFFEGPRAGSAGRRPGRMTLDRDARTRPGDLVLVRPGGQRGRGHAKVVHRIGRPDVAADVLEALMLDRGLPRRFDAAVDRAAREARDRGIAATGRRDLTDLPTFTVDPASARDFDDAISAEVLGGGRTRIWVHIADVAAYVPPGSLVDREAARRATSVYLPGRVEPMLPEALSNDACSLVPHQQRAALSVELDFDGAQVVRAAFHRSTVRSDARLTYEDVDAVFARAAPALEPWAGPLAAARTVAAALQERRRQRSALEIESSEPEFELDRDGHVVGSRPVTQTESHRLVEHLMIAANEQVAKRLEESAVPALYRVHEAPGGEGALRLVEQLDCLGVATPPVGEHVAPSEAAEVVVECSRLVDAHVRRTGRGRAGLTFLVLRALKQARYDPRNVGHAGLGLERYCHFTSPIRRYPDLVCHRALLGLLGAAEPAPSAGEVAEAGAWSSEREREALALERLGDRVARCFELERSLLAARDRRREFDGEVTGIIGAGAFVRFGGTPSGARADYEGLLAVRRLGADWWELDERGTTLVGAPSRRAISIGDPVRVAVDRIDAPRGRVDLLAVEL